MHVVHTVIMARVTTTMMMMTIEAAMARPGSTFGLTVVVDMTVASHRHGEPADCVLAREIEFTTERHQVCTRGVVIWCLTEAVTEAAM